MVRWPCSSSAGGWHFEVLPSFARSCPKPCVCAPLRENLEVVSSTVVSAMVRCWVMNFGFRLVRRADFSGRFLGLRILRAACIVEVTVRARQALEHDWEAGHRLASSPVERTGEQATGRVDVPGEAHYGLYKQKVAAASLTVASQHTPFLTERCVGSPLEKWEKDNPVFQIFVRDLMGKSVSLRVPSQITGDELSLAVSVATGVPLEFFLLNNRRT